MRHSDKEKKPVPGSLYQLRRTDKYAMLIKTESFSTNNGQALYRHYFLERDGEILRAVTDVETVEDDEYWSKFLKKVEIP